MTHLDTPSIDVTLADLEDGADVQVDDPTAAPVSVRPVGESENFVDKGQLGLGGMGEVRFVFDRRLQREMAMKLLRTSCDKDSRWARRFVEEAQITGQLDHPNIVPVHQLGVDDRGALFFTMKLVRGKTFAEILTELGDARLAPHNMERMVEILIKTCDAVGFAHSRGVFHRDLKPSNIMVGSYGQVYVMDWGLADLRDGPRLVDDTNKVLGTASFMAPEQAHAERVDERTDVYGIGGLLYCALTDAPPHPGDNRREAFFNALTEDVAAPASLVTAPLPPELCRIAMKALHRVPEKRYTAVKSLQHDLEQFLRGGGWLATRTFTKGDLIIRQGEEASEAYVITEGSCAIYTEIDGVRETLREVDAGNVIGETALLSDHKRAANVVALDDVTVKVITRDSLERELQSSSWMRALFTGVAARFAELDTLLTDHLKSSS